METKTHFDLTSAMENWQQELRDQSHLSAETRRELKTHLCDTVTELQKRGLNDEESFWLARRRVGHPQQLDEEFVKANPAVVWRKRVLWMAAALLAVSLWTVSANIIERTIMESVNHASNPLARSQLLWRTPFQITFSFLLHNSPIFVLGFFLLRGTGRIFSLLESLFQSRSRFICVALGWLTLNQGFYVFRWLADLKNYNSGNGPIISIWANLFLMLIWPLTLVVLIAWLMTPQDRKTPKHA
jgi:hypothetical protein